MEQRLAFWYRLIMEMLDTARNAAFEKAPWLRLHDMALGKARTVPTMLTQDEQKLYFWLTAFWAEGTGAVVDLGCFVGGSTARLAEGASLSGCGSKINAFDRFTANEGLKERMLYAKGVAAFEGNDILPVAQDLLSPWSDRVSLCRGEIEEMDWTGGDIEILVMDASKQAGTMDRMSRKFMPHLQPGKSLLIQQDFLHWSQPWVPAQMELLAEFFEPMAFVERDTLVFLCSSVPDDAAMEAASTDRLSDSELLDLLKSAQARYATLGWGLTDRLEEVVLGLLANPGKRAAFQFKRS